MVEAKPDPVDGVRFLGSRLPGCAHLPRCTASSGARRGPRGRDALHWARHHGGAANLSEPRLDGERHHLGPWRISGARFLSRVSAYDGARRSGGNIKKDAPKLAALLRATDPGDRSTPRSRTLSPRENRYEPGSDTLTFTAAEADSFRTQQQKWRDYFSAPDHNGGLTAGLIETPEELRKLTAFFAWAAWASAARRPGRVYSYTNNFPYDPLAGNVPTSDAVFCGAP